MNIFNAKFIDKTLELFEKWYIIFFILLLLLTSYNLFYNLGRIPIFSWDEARHGVNAYEMIKRNNYIVSTYGYEKDYWNLKPPLSYWAIVLGYKIAGFNPLGLRIMSAFSAFLTVVIVSLITLHKHGKLASLISTIVLATTIPFVLEHCARTGDADAIFVLFFTIAMSAMLMANENIKWIYITGLGFSFAFLAKSWHAVNIILIIGIYLIFSKLLLRLKFSQVIIFILTCSIPVFIWALLRYQQDGITFFSTMINYDLLARTSKALEGHIGGISFYIEKLQASYFYWLLILVGAILSSSLIIKPDKSNNEWITCMLAILLWISVPFILYTKAKTKIPWYITPIYPAMAITIGASSSFLLKCRYRNVISQILLIVMIILSIYKNEISIIKSISSPVIDYAQAALLQIKSMPSYRGRHIYTLFRTGSADNPNRWEQSYLLCAELYGDLIPLEGGIEGFLKDNTQRPLFLVDKDKITETFKVSHNLKTLIENENVYILTK